MYDCAVSFRVAFNFFKFTVDGRCVSVVVSGRHVGGRRTVGLDCRETLSATTHHAWTRPRSRGDRVHDNNAVRRALWGFTSAITMPSLFYRHYRAPFSPRRLTHFCR